MVTSNHLLIMCLLDRLHGDRGPGHGRGFPGMDSLDRCFHVLFGQGLHQSRTLDNSGTRDNYRNHLLTA